MLDQLQDSDHIALWRKKQRCNKITCQLSREMMLLLLQTRVRFRQTSTTHLSAAIYNIVIITTCPHCISPGVPPAAAETTGQKTSVHLNHTQTNPKICGKMGTNRKYQAAKPRAWIGALSCQLSHSFWETSGKDRDRKLSQVILKAP